MFYNKEIYFKWINGEGTFELKHRKDKQQVFLDNQQKKKPECTLCRFFFFKADSLTRQLIHTKSWETLEEKLKNT